MTLISRDAVARELDRGTVEERRTPGLPLEPTWHVVGRAGEDLPPTAALFLDGLATLGEVAGSEAFRRVASSSLSAGQ